MVLNVVGSSPICHPKEKRNASNDFPLFCCAASRDSRRECQCLLIEEKKQVTSAANYHWLSVQVLLDTLLFMQRYFASYPWILFNRAFGPLKTHKLIESKKAASDNIASIYTQSKATLYISQKQSLINPSRTHHPFAQIATRSA